MCMGRDPPVGRSLLYSRGKDGLPLLFQQGASDSFIPAYSIIFLTPIVSTGGLRHFDPCPYE